MSGGQRSNWVDRGEAPDATIRRVLAHHLGIPEGAEESLLDHDVVAIVGMVDAHANEVGVASYVGYIEKAMGRPLSPASQRRLVGIALWHIAKAALVRDAAMRERLGQPKRGPGPAGSHVPLAEWIAQRILTPEEQEADAAMRRAAMRAVGDESPDE